MNSWVKSLLVLSLITVIGLFTFNYEPFPVKSVSKAKVMSKVDKANGDIVKITSDEQGYQWYISEIEKADENFIQLMKDKGWSFVKKDKNNSYFFESVQGNIVAVGEKWNDKYKVFNFPKGI